MDLTEFALKFAKAFVQLFFAVDAVGVLPMFVSLTDDLTAPARRKSIRQMVLTALIVGVGFLFFGRQLLGWVGLVQQDFMIAGGAMLFLIAVGDMFSGRQVGPKIGAAIGAVPLGTPLIVGPAVLTMELMLVDTCGWGATLAAVILNVILAGVFFRLSDRFTRLLGRTGVSVVSKIACLILAAIAVMMIRGGVEGIIRDFKR
ncbi:MAG: MarC family protein [Planctomycetota bacterium]|nr:MarC family protein [Planctomycetota bacterium]